MPRRDYLDDFLDATEKVDFLGGTLTLAAPSEGDQRNLQAFVIASPGDMGGLTSRCILATVQVNNRRGGVRKRTPEEWLRLVALAGEEGNALTEAALRKCGFGVVNDRITEAVNEALKAPEEPDDLPS